MKIVLFITGSDYIDKRKRSLSNFVNIPSPEEGWWSIYSENDERGLLIHNDDKRPGEDWERLAQEQLTIEDIEEVLIASHDGAFVDDLHSKIEQNAIDAFDDIRLHYVTFSREPGNPVWDQLAEFLFARESGSGSSESLPDVFDELADAIRKKKLTPEISRLKHSLSHCLLPIVVDLQGWEESNFDEDYREEIVTEYKDGGVRKNLREAHELIYGPREPSSIKSIVNEVSDRVDNERADIISEKWGNVRMLFPPNFYNLIDAPSCIEAITVISYLNLGNIDLLRKELKLSPSGSNPVQEWYDDLEYALGELRDEILDS